MPVEIRTADPRLWSRPSRQNVTPLPLIPTESPLERRRRRGRAAIHLAILLLGAAAMASFSPF
jgi:hypothetical protein